MAGALLLAGCEAPAPADNRYAFESIVSFGTDGGSERFRREGWSHTERLFTWTDGTRAKLELRLPITNRPLGLRMKLAGMKPADLAAQPVDVFANGKQIAHWQVGAPAFFSAVIPPDLLRRSGKLKIELKMPRATSPKSLGHSADSRLLGVSCTELQISKAGHGADIWPQN